MSLAVLYVVVEVVVVRSQGAKLARYNADDHHLSGWHDPQGYERAWQMHDEFFSLVQQ